MLSYELRRYKPDENIIDRLIVVSKIQKIIEKNSDSGVLGEALLYLSLTESLEAVDVIFKLLRDLDETHYKEIESGFELALFGVDSRLYDKQHVAINDKVYELIPDDDPIFQQRGMKLHQRKMRDRR